MMTVLCVFGTFPLRKSLSTGLVSGWAVSGHCLLNSFAVHFSVSSEVSLPQTTSWIRSE